jgi:hypothetical protein
MVETESAKARPRKFGKRAIIGLLLLLCSFFMGALLRNSAELTNTLNSRGFNICDTRISWLCIPTYYLPIPLEPSLWLVLNATSLLSSAILFVSGVVLLRE